MDDALGVAVVEAVKELAGEAAGFATEQGVVIGGVAALFFQRAVDCEGTTRPRTGERQAQTAGEAAPSYRFLSRHPNSTRECDG